MTNIYTNVLSSSGWPLRLLSAVSEASHLSKSIAHSHRWNGPSRRRSLSHTSVSANSGYA